MSSSTGMVGRFRNAAHDGLLKTHVRIASRPARRNWRSRSGSRSPRSRPMRSRVALHLMLPLWAVLTSLIVTQMSVGRSLKATRDYMLGTVGGAIYGGAIAVLIPHSGEGGLLALLVLAVAPLAFIAAINPSLSAATVTAVIVLLVPTMHHANPLDSAIDRVIEVTVGALTGLAVSFLVLPSRAVSQIRVNAARLLELLAAAFAELLAGLTRGLDNDALHRIQDGIGAAMTSLHATGAGSRARARGAPVVGPGYRPVAAHHPAPAPRRRDDRPRQRGAAAGECAGAAGAAAVRRQQRDRRLYACGGRILAKRQRRCGYSARRCGAAGLCRRSRRVAQRGPDPRRARRCRGAVLRAGILAGADAAEPERSRPLPCRLVREAGQRSRPVQRASQFSQPAQPDAAEPGRSAGETA